MSTQPIGSREGDYYTRKPGHLVPSADLGPHWRAVEGPVIRGWPLVDMGRQELGRLQDVLVDTDTGKAIFAIVTRGGLAALGGRRLLVPVDALRLEEPDGRAALLRPVNTLDEAPTYDPDNPRYDLHYDYWSSRRPLAHEPMPERSAPTAEPVKQEGHARHLGRRTRLRILRTPLEPGREGEEEAFTVSMSDEEIVIETGPMSAQAQEEEEIQGVRSSVPEEEREGDSRPTA